MTEQLTDKTGEESSVLSRVPHKQGLSLSGAGYLLGDAAMMAAGFLRAKQQHQDFSAVGEIRAGGFWLMGGLAAALYGNPDEHARLNVFTHTLEEYLAQRGVTIPAEAQAQHPLLKSPSFWEKCQDFLYSHPSEILNGLFGIGAVLMTHSGLKQTAQEVGSRSLRTMLKSENLGKVHNNVWMGGLITVGALAGLLVKEDPTAPKRAEQGNWFEKAFAYVKERPLRVTGTLYAANNLFLIRKVMHDFKDARAAGKVLHPVLFTTLTAATYVLSNIVLMTTHRDTIGHQEFSAETRDELEKAAAAIIASQPPELQAAVLHEISAYMATQKVVALQAPEIEQRLNARLAQLTAQPETKIPANSNWVAREDARAAADVHYTR